MQRYSTFRVATGRDELGRFIIFEYEIVFQENEQDFVILTDPGS